MTLRHFLQKFSVPSCSLSFCLIRHCFFFGLGLGLLDGHPVLYTLHTVYVVGEFGGQVQFGCIAGFTIQRDVAIVRLDLGVNGAGRSMIQQRQLDLGRDRCGHPSWTRAQAC